MGSKEMVGKYVTDCGIVLVGNSKDRINEATDYQSVALVDGLNVAYSRNDKKARLSDVTGVAKLLKSSFDDMEIYVDATTRHVIDDKQTLENLILKNKIFLCPSGISADDLIWVRAVSLIERGYDVYIVTNDNFPVTRSKKKGTKIRNLTASILDSGEIYLLERSIKYSVSLKSVEMELVSATVNEVPK